MGDAIVKSFSQDEDEILLSIMKLHNDGQPFDLDPCFSRGSFYKSGRVPKPSHLFDKTPLDPGTQQALAENLPLDDCSVGSIVFDPPFIFNPHGRFSNASIRFTSFPTWGDLEAMYRGSLREFMRILKPKGIVAFKCQDITDSKTTMTHCHVFNWATEAGFYAKDMFIRIRHHGPVYNPFLKQKHARKFHSYWFVLQKPNRTATACD